MKPSIAIQSKFLINENITAKQICFGLEKSHRSGWFCLELVATNDAGRVWLSEQDHITLTQIGSPFSISLIAVGDKRRCLVFYRKANLEKIRINWSRTNSNSSFPTLNLRLKAISLVSACLHMLKCVSLRDKAQGVDWQRVYRKSWARNRRHGIHHALRKLVHEYHPLLSHQLATGDAYEFWLKNFETKLDLCRRNMELMGKIRFKIVIVNQDDDEEGIRLTIASLIQQSYLNFDLIVLSNRPLVQALSEQVISRDIEITVYDLDDKHRQQLDLKAYYLWLNARDELAHHALEAFAGSLFEQSEAKIAYSDHDILDQKRNRRSPYFKPAWNPDLLTAHHYIGPSVIIKGDLLDDSDWLSGAYQRTLKAAMKLMSIKQDHSIKHLPHVLYHQSQKSQDKVLGDIEIDQIKKIHEQFATKNGTGLQRLVFNHEHQVFRAVYRIPNDLPKVSLIIPTRDSMEITKACVDSILQRTSYPNYEILIINNQSCETKTKLWLQEIATNPRVRVLDYDHPFNYSAINNFAVDHAQGSVVGLVNNDTQVINRGWLTEMLRHVLRPEIGCVGAKLYYFDDTVQHGGVILGLWGVAGHSHKNYIRDDIGYQKRLICVQNYSAVTAACLLIRKNLFLDVDGLNAESLAVAFNDVDLCLKVRRLGFRNLWTPYAELYHYESKSRGKSPSDDQKKREFREIQFMKEAWGKELSYDPCYSPNLTHTREDFSIRLDRF